MNIFTNLFSGSVGLVLGWCLALFNKDISDWASRLVLGPKLKVDFEADSDCMTLAHETYEELINNDHFGPTITKNRSIMYIRLRVTNTKSRTALECRPSLTKVEEKVDGKFVAVPFGDTIPLTWSFDAAAEQLEISKGVTRFIEVVRLQSDVQEFQPCFRGQSGRSFMPRRLKPVFEKPGTLRFTVHLAAKDVPPITKQVTVSWDGKWPPKAWGAYITASDQS
jgi:hypothetical protein